MLGFKFLVINLNFIKTKLLIMVDLNLILSFLVVFKTFKRLIFFRNRSSSVYTWRLLARRGVSSVYNRIIL